MSVNHGTALLSRCIFCFLARFSASTGSTFALKKATEHQSRSKQQEARHAKRKQNNYLFGVGRAGGAGCAIGVGRTGGGIGVSVGVDRAGAIVGVGRGRGDGRTGGVAGAIVGVGRAGGVGVGRAGDVIVQYLIAERTLFAYIKPPANALCVEGVLALFDRSVNCMYCN